MSSTDAATTAAVCCFVIGLFLGVFIRHVSEEVPRWTIRSYGTELITKQATPPRCAP